MRARFERSTPDLDTSAETPVLAHRKPMAPSTPAIVDALGFPAQPPAVARLLVPGDEYLDPARRLVVLVPDADTDESALASQVWTMASPRGLSILYLTVGHDHNTLYRAMRRLAHLSAITRDDRVQVETRLADDSDWVPATQACWRPGDLVVCHAEQQVGRWGWRRPLSQVLLRTLNAPVSVLSGFYTAAQLVPRNAVIRATTWVFPLVIIALFFWLQARIVQLPDTPFETVLLLSSVLIEFGLIWTWHRFTM